MPPQMHLLLKSPRFPPRATGLRRGVLTAVTLAAGNVLLVAILADDGLARRVAFVAVGVPIAIWVGLRIVERPQRGLLLLAALVPFDGLRQLYPVPAGWKESIVLFTLAATFVAPEMARGPAHRRLPDWSLVLGGLVGITVVSAIVVGGMQGVLGLKISFFYVLVALTAWRCPLDARERDGLVSILMVTGVVTALYGLFQQVLGPERLVELGYSYERSVFTASGYFRSFSSFLTNFPFALFLMLVLLIALPVALRDHARPRNRWFLVIGAPLVVLGMISSLTRSAWVGLFVGLLYLGVSHFRVLLVAMVQIVVIGALALALAGGWGAAFLSEDSSADRVEIWSDNLAQVVAHPLGLGTGATGSTAEKLELDEGGDRSDALQADNYFLEMALELGPIGLWLFIVLLIMLFRDMHRASLALPRRDAAFASGVTAMVIASVAVSLSSAYFEVFPLDVYYWLLVGVVAATTAGARESADEPIRELLATRTAS
jgi:hypothetical protein